MLPPILPYILIVIVIFDLYVWLYESIMSLSTSLLYKTYLSILFLIYLRFDMVLSTIHQWKCLINVLIPENCKAPGYLYA